MPRNIDDVIVPERRKSIRNIPIPEGRRRNERTASMDGVKKRESHPKEESMDLPPPPPKRVPPPPRHHRGWGRRVVVAGILALGVLTLAILSLFDGATLSYTPKSAALTFANDVFSAAKTGEKELLYSVIKLSGDKGKSVSANGEREVARKASGIIVVYNDTATDQPLIATTRFESSAGKVYRIEKGITVPKKNGSQPGFIEATVVADAPGESYNSAPTDFTLPGLKGKARYTTVYARSKSPLAGGFVGKEKSVSENDLLTTRNELKATLTEDLLGKAQAEVPEDFILFPSLSSVTFEDLPQSASGDSGSVNVNLRGHLYGIMFKKAELARALATEKTQVLANDSVDLESFGNLKVSFSGTPPTDLISLSKISFKVEGSALLLWKTDEVALKSDLLGRGQKELTSILKNYPTVASADATLRPFWKQTFPTQADKITIKKLRAQ